MDKITTYEFFNSIEEDFKRDFKHINIVDRYKIVDCIPAMSIYLKELKVLFKNGGVPYLKNYVFEICYMNNNIKDFLLMQSELQDYIENKFGTIKNIKFDMSDKKIMVCSFELSY